jgi:hypothetical protein
MLRVAEEFVFNIKANWRHPLVCRCRASTEIRTAWPTKNKTNSASIDRRVRNGGGGLRRFLVTQIARVASSTVAWSMMGASPLRSD